MKLKELQKMARRSVGEWCGQMPADGDYGDPEVFTDRWSGLGAAPADGDYVMIMIFHNRKEAEGGAECER